MEIKFRSRCVGIGDKRREIPVLVATMKIEKFTLRATIILPARFQENRKVPENFGLAIFKGKPLYDHFFTFAKNPNAIVRYSFKDDKPTWEVASKKVVTAVCKTSKTTCVDYGVSTEIYDNAEKANAALEKYGLSVEKIQQFYEEFKNELELEKEKYFAKNQS